MPKVNRNFLRRSASDVSSCRLQPCKWIPFPSLLLVLMAGLYCPVDAAQVVLQPIKDTTLYEDPAGTLSNGSGDHLFAGRVASTGDFRNRRALLAFDIAANVPAGATIVSVTLNMRVSRTPTSNSHPIALHRVNADWGESTSHAGGQEGGGIAAAAGDATWRYRFFSTDLWTTLGGDFQPIASVSTSVGPIGDYTWNSTPQLVADVQAWLDSPATNFGWIMIGNETVPVTAKRFNGKDFVGDPLLRPQLTVVYADCDDDAECADLDDCTLDRCVDFTCSNIPLIYGDVDMNGTISLFDLFCVLDALADEFTDCTFEAVDIEPCGGNGTINLLDLFAVLNAFSDIFACEVCP